MWNAVLHRERVRGTINQGRHFYMRKNWGVGQCLEEEIVSLPFAPLLDPWSLPLLKMYKVYLVSVTCWVANGLFFYRSGQKLFSQYDCLATQGRSSEAAVVALPPLFLFNGLLQTVLQVAALSSPAASSSFVHREYEGWVLEKSLMFRSCRYVVRKCQYSTMGIFVNCPSLAPSDSIAL